MTERFSFAWIDPRGLYGSDESHRDLGLVVFYRDAKLGRVKFTIHPAVWKRFASKLKPKHYKRPKHMQTSIRPLRVRRALGLELQHFQKYRPDIC